MAQLKHFGPAARNGGGARLLREPSSAELIALKLMHRERTKPEAKPVTIRKFSWEIQA